MAQIVRDVMNASPRTLDATDTITRAAKIMRDDNIGAVIVAQGRQLRGVVTDRDIVVRAVANGGNLSSVQLDEVCSGDIVTVPCDASLDDAADIMRMRAVRRLPVTEHGHVVGVVSIGDLAMERDSRSALADISAALPNV
jgi:CBS domain-containing protein